MPQLKKMTKVPHSCKGWTNTKNKSKPIGGTESQTKQLEEDKETAIREKCDYTINQERLAENIWCDLEKEYANRVQDYLKQLKDEMRAKIKSKTTAIRDQYKTELNQEIGKLKAEWAQEWVKTNEQHNAQISQVLKEVEGLKEQSRSQPKAESNKPCTIQYNLTSSILMTKIPSLVIQVTRSSVTLAIHLCNNRSVVKSQPKPW